MLQIVMMVMIMSVIATCFGAKSDSLIKPLLILLDLVEL